MRIAAAAAILFLAAAGVPARTILFVGNSFTFGANSPVRVLNADRVVDLNGGRVGGVPGLFRRFAEEAGLDWQVSLETSPGRTLAWHLVERRALIDRAWDHVVLQDYSTLDPERPGDGTASAAAIRALAALLRARNRHVGITLVATWTRPDLTFLPNRPWSGRPLEAMADDLRRATDASARGAGADVAPVGQAFGCAVRAGVADADPYDGIDYGRMPLWSHDQYHASSFGYYLEALVIFARVTGVDPRTLGAAERAAEELGFSATETLALQRAAHAAIATDGACGR